MAMTFPLEEELVEVLVDEKDVHGRGLVVHNDEVNTFDHVIETLIKVCGHEPNQAEQCTMIIHFKGKCEVKKGTYETLKPLKDGIINEGINATIV
ncbi:MAG: ATP-dependent Clp protease adaptor ClpS [Reichenbachiella sp.]